MPSRRQPTPRHAVPRRAGLALLLLLLAGAPATPAAEPAAARAGARGGELLHALDDAVAALAARVSPAVVQIEVSGYGLQADESGEESAYVARQHALGSGVIVDPAGFILTNNHVVRGAQRITVVLASPAGRAPTGADANARRLFSARLVGADPRVDLALLKIDAAGLSHLPLAGDHVVRQGELVFAIGSPQGLSSTITMGVVGSASREVGSPQPLAYIQTDAPINPGNSGGPLVDTRGQLVGINTFIVSRSGGSQGLGFAIPAGLARTVYESLRTHGRVRRTESGLAAQEITPALARGLGLPRDWGVVVADTAFGGAARQAGVQVGDIIDTLDGHPIENLADVTSAVYQHRLGTPVMLGVVRGAQKLMLRVDAPEARQPADQLVDLASPEQGLVRKLGLVGVDVSERLAGIIPPLQIGTGVVVAARTLDGTSVESGLQVGDVIHSVNRREVVSVEALRAALEGLPPGAPVALQIERQGKLAFLAFEME